MSAVTVAIEPPRQPGVVRLLAMSDAYMAALYPPESNHGLDLDALEAPGVLVFVARDGADVVGCCALVDRGGGWGEIKRLFVDPAARGRAVGALLIDAAEAAARRNGLRVVRLETGVRQPEALRLYRGRRYAEIPAFDGYAPDPLSVFMEKRLEPDGPAGRAGR